MTIIKLILTILAIIAVLLMLCFIMCANYIKNEVKREERSKK